MSQTAAEWNAATDRVKADIAREKYLQAGRELSREKRRMKLQDYADKRTEVDLQRADVALQKDVVSLKGDQIGLAGAKDKLRYLGARQQLEQRLLATELLTLEVDLAGSQAKLTELRNVAKTLNQEVRSYVPRNIFGGATDAPKQID